MQTCPIISFKKCMFEDKADHSQLAEAVDEALSTFGAFFIIDHGVDVELCHKVLRDFKTFFNLPLEEKRLFQLSNRSQNRGYESFETINVSAFMDRPGYPNDAVERFLFGPIELLFSSYVQDSSDFIPGWAPNVYADCFRDTFKRYYKAVENLSHVLMEIMSVAMGQPKSYLEDLCCRAPTSLTVSHYPKVDKVKERQERMAAHVDKTPFAIILQDDTKEALKMKTVNGDWINVNSPRPDALFVVVGQCLELLTNNHWPGTVHYVSFPADLSQMKARLSMTYFILMNQNVVLKALPQFLDENGGSLREPIIYRDMVQNSMKRLITQGTLY